MAADEDQALIERARRGEREAFAALLRRHGPSIRRATQLLVGDPSTADDAFQETFLTAFRSLDGYRGTGSVRAWLFAIARRHAQRCRGDQPRGPALESSLEALGPLAGWGQPDAPTVTAMMVREAFGLLTEDDQRLVWLHDVEGWSGEETAEVLGISLAAAKSRLHRARLRLLACLTDLPTSKAPRT